MIITLNYGQPELKITPSYSGWRGLKPFALADVRLHIRPPDGRRFVGLSPIVRKGDWGYPLPIEEYPPVPNKLPVLVYPAFDMDDSGAFVFRLDGKLWKRRCGRYLAELYIRDRKVGEIELDLSPVKCVIGRVEAAEREDGDDI
jgi:hypothetical protein